MLLSFDKTFTSHFALPICFSLLSSLVFHFHSHRNHVATAYFHKRKRKRDGETERERKGESSKLSQPYTLNIPTESIVWIPYIDASTTTIITLLAFDIIQTRAFFASTFSTFSQQQTFSVYALHALFHRVDVDKRYK